ncbi:MAG: DUF1385 domain-containing protein [Oscillospiraceae bacterium]|nr:DUF1385 domain-containing protein [Oscillospiraceae bacterium]
MGKKTSIGGQAVIEGIAMRGPKVTVLACRLPNGKIDVERFCNKKMWKIFKLPIVRGFCNMVIMLMDGYKYTNLSMMKSGLYEDDDEGKQGKLHTVFVFLGTILGVIVSIGLFTYLPQLLTKIFIPAGSNGLRSVVEGVLKIFLMVLYMWLISLLKDIKRVFKYHGAEHKTITCYEKGLDLTPENVMTCSRFHPRCGTSFLLFTLLISILVSIPLHWEDLIVRMISKLFLVPLIVGISYEVIRIAGKSDGMLMKVLFAPGMWLQRITTKEPDEKVVEVAIKSLSEVLTHIEVGADNW